jgi:Ca2+-binding RTX toxin-like protein
MASVTVPGSNSATTSVTTTYGNDSNFALAQQIADALAQAAKLGALTVTTVSGGSVPPPPTSTVPGAINELIIESGGVYSIPAGSKDAPDYVVVLDNTDPVTIFGAGNSSIMGGSGGKVTIVDPAVITLSEGAGDATVTLTESDTDAVLAGNNHNDTLTALGVRQSIAGGTGTNSFYALGANDTVSAQGTSDTLFGGTGSATFIIASNAVGETVLADSGALTVSDAGKSTTVFGGTGALKITTSGSLASVVGGEGALKATDIGTSDTIFAGAGAASVTLAGSTALVVGGSGVLSVVDSGSNDTVNAGAGTTNISAPGGAFVRGGTGLLNFVGGTKGSLILGGSGNATVFGGTGGTTLYGGAGASQTYFNLSGGELVYAAGNGSETLDARLSNGSNTIFGGADPNGQYSLLGGVGNDTILGNSGSATMAGGGGNNLFIFSNGGASTDVISDFSAIDTVYLAGYGSAAAGDALAAAVTTTAGTTITLSDNTKITFTGVNSSAALQGHIFST